MLIKAIAILKQEYQGIKVYVAGDMPFNRNLTIKERIRINGYSNYLRKLMNSLDIEKNIIFTAPLTSEQVIEKLLSCHVCIYPSSIENGSSLGEAQFIGTPVIASYVGGMPDMIGENQSGLLYRFEEFEMLAYNIKRIFDDDNFAMSLSDAGKAVASQRHDRNLNRTKLLKIYAEITGK
jgi:glycosyltransferase involved in cell wall biosynthesis